MASVNYKDQLKVVPEENLGAVEQKVARKQVMVVEIVVEVAYLEV